MNLFKGDAPEASRDMEIRKSAARARVSSGANIKIFATATLRRKSMGLKSADHSK